jgi:hypothetical protein
MSDLVRGGAVDEIRQKSVAVRGHRDHVDLFGAGDADQFVGRVARGEAGLDGKALGRELLLQLREVGAVGFHLL